MMDFPLKRNVAVAASSFEIDLIAYLGKLVLEDRTMISGLAFLTFCCVLSKGLYKRLDISRL